MFYTPDQYAKRVMWQAIDYYRNTKLSEDELRADITKNWPSQHINAEVIIKKVLSHEKEKRNPGR